MLLALDSLLILFLIWFSIKVLKALRFTAMVLLFQIISLILIIIFNALHLANKVLYPEVPRRDNNDWEVLYDLKNWMVLLQELFLLSTFNIDLYKWCSFLLMTIKSLSLTTNTFRITKLLLIIALVFVQILLFTVPLITVFIDISKEDPGLSWDPVYLFFYTTFIFGIF